MKCCSTVTLLVLVSRDTGPQQYMSLFYGCDKCPTRKRLTFKTPAHCRLLFFKRERNISHVCSFRKPTLPFRSVSAGPFLLVCRPSHIIWLWLLAEGCSGEGKLSFSLPLSLQKKCDNWSSQIASLLPSYKLIDSKWEIRMFWKLLRSHRHLSQHRCGGSVKMEHQVFLMWDFCRIWKKHAKSFWFSI